MAPLTPDSILTSFDTPSPIAIPAERLVAVFKEAVEGLLVNRTGFSVTIKNRV